MRILFKKHWVEEARQIVPTEMALVAFAANRADAVANELARSAQDGQGRTAEEIHMLLHMVAEMRMQADRLDSLDSLQACRKLFAESCMESTLQERRQPYKQGAKDTRGMSPWSITFVVQCLLLTRTVKRDLEKTVRRVLRMFLPPELSQPLCAHLDEMPLPTRWTVARHRFWADASMMYMEAEVDAHVLQSDHRKLHTAPCTICNCALLCKAFTATTASQSSAPL